MKLIQNLNKNIKKLFVLVFVSVFFTFQVNSQMVKAMNIDNFQESHITEELNQNFDNEPITTMNWPAFNEEYIVQEKVTIAVQFNGKTRGKLELAPGLSQEKTMEYLKKSVFGKKYLSGGETIKIIHIPDKILNIVIK